MNTKEAVVFGAADGRAAGADPISATANEESEMDMVERVSRLALYRGRRGGGGRRGGNTGVDTHP